LADKKRLWASIQYWPSKTGALEAYGKQTQAGLLMGWSTPRAAAWEAGGDREGWPGQARPGQSLLATAYSDDKADG